LPLRKDLCIRPTRYNYCSWLKIVLAVLLYVVGVLSKLDVCAAK